MMGRRQTLETDSRRPLETDSRGAASKAPGGCEKSPP